MVKNIVNSFDTEFFENVTEFLIDFTKNTDQYILFIIWGFLFLGIFSLFWAFFLKFNKNIRVGEFISRIFMSFVLFYFLWLVLDILGIKLILKN